MVSSSTNLTNICVIITQANTMCEGLNTLLKMPSMYQDQTQIGMFRAQELELEALQS